jgi:MoaA/NifB/PqqE/SkfB family radical SAM enzyme
MMDPANNCHLGCPGCLHTRNRSISSTFDWPGGLLEPEMHEGLLETLGPYAWGGVYYNSTNLSVRFDADALVQTGLNFLFLSIDGATQETYGRFRRGGELDLVLDNVRRLVEAKRRLGTGTPFLLWRYLTFEHNLHEVELARQLATELGVDQFSVTTPFGVAWDDPDVRAATSPHQGAYVLNPDARFRGPLDDWRISPLAEEAIHRQFERAWVDRPGLDAAADEPSRAQAPTCHWLYQSLTLDARGRVLPCCMAPEIHHHKVYGSASGARPETLVNLTDLRRSRLGFADRPAFDAEMASHPGQTAPYCSVCWEKPEMTYTLDRDARRDLRLLDPQRTVGDGLAERLTSWPASR